MRSGDRNQEPETRSQETGARSQEAGDRKRVVEVAYSWLGTPYHTGGKVKGVGVDCLTLLAGIFEEAGLVSDVAIPYYPNDWHLHRTQERYLEGLLTYCKETKEPQAGDIALWKFGRCFSHGAIIIDYPLIIHAFVGRECVLEDLSKSDWLNFIGTKASNKPRPVRFFSVF